MVKNSFDHTACTRPGLPPRQDEVAAENVTVVLDASLGRHEPRVLTLGETPVLLQLLPDV